MNKLNEFIKLHHQDEPLLIGNIWDIQSAILFQKSRFKALGTSSAAIASSLGYEDGEKMSFQELLQIVKNIQVKINIPLTVDIEGGYSRNPLEIVEHIKKLQLLGVVGVNLEDSVVEHDRKILDALEFSNTIREIKTILNESIFLNIRTDYYIMELENPLEETIKRVKLYEEAGADGIFIPCVTKENEIKRIVESTRLPINVMRMPELPNFKRLQKLGVKRISMGSFPYNNMVSHLRELIETSVSNQSFSNFFQAQI